MKVTHLSSSETFPNGLGGRSGILICQITPTSYDTEFMGYREHTNLVLSRKRVTWYSIVFSRIEVIARIPRVK